jgi:hypothetical protein
VNHAEDLIGILEGVARILERPDTDVAWSRYNTVEEAVEDMNQHVARLRKGDFAKVEDLVTLFAPTGSLQEISISSGWGDAYREIAARFDGAVESMRLR